MRKFHSPTNISVTPIIQINIVPERCGCIIINIAIIPSITIKGIIPTLNFSIRLLFCYKKYENVIIIANLNYSDGWKVLTSYYKPSFCSIFLCTLDKYHNKKCNTCNVCTLPQPMFFDTCDNQYTIRKHYYKPNSSHLYLLSCIIRTWQATIYRCCIAR